MGLEFDTSKLGDAVNWARKFSLFKYPFVTACCGMEFMSTSRRPKYDIARFGAEFPRFSPRQADLLIIVGTDHRAAGPGPAPHLRADVRAQVGDRLRRLRVDRRLLPELLDDAGRRSVMPVDVYIPGCPPRPEQVLDGLILLQENIQQRRRPQPGRRIKAEQGYDVPLAAIRPRSAHRRRK